MTPHAQPWKQLRELEPPLGAKRRVLNAVEDELAREPTRRWLRLALASVTAAALALVLVLWQRSGDRDAAESAAETPPPSPSRPHVVSPTQPRARQQPAPTRQPAAQLQIAKDDSVSVDTTHARVTVRGPATFRVDRDRLEVKRGTFEVVGKAVVTAPICEARISGRAHVAVSSRSVQVSVFAGNAEVVPGTAECTVLRMVALPKPSAYSAPQKPNAANEPKHATAPAKSTLRRQVEDFRRARAIREPAPALAAWRAWLKRWPNSPLRAEAIRAIGELNKRIAGSGRDAKP